MILSPMLGFFAIKSDSGHSTLYRRKQQAKILAEALSDHHRKPHGRRTRKVTNL
jgi:hypothetical protein